MSRKRIRNLILLLLVAGGMSSRGSRVHAGEKARAKDNLETSKAKSRTFKFTYAASVNKLPAGAKVRVWIPQPQSNEHQKIKRVRQSLPSAKVGFSTESKYRNKMLYFESKAPESGEIDFSVTYRVKRSEVVGLTSMTGTELTKEQRKLFLSANSKVPIDGKPAALLAGLDLPMNDALGLGKFLYNKVGAHMRYDKSKPGFGTGDAVWACDSRFGNCTDFHSLFISMTRSQGVPARFEIGFPLPEKRGEGDIGGYHCWAFFHVDDHGWVPVDISEADKHPEQKKYYFGNLTENRVTFTIGRDLTLVPKQDAGSLNYFVYPHVEVDGKVWPKEKMEKRFKFKDI